MTDAKFLDLILSLDVTNVRNKQRSTTVIESVDSLI